MSLWLTARTAPPCVPHLEGRSGASFGVSGAGDGSRVRGIRHDVGMLTERQVDILTFEGNHPEASSGVKEGLVREAWNIRMSSYYQELFQIVELPEALADPRFTMTVKRVQKQKVERTERRASRRPA